jgi:hypothetical protein
MRTAVVKEEGLHSTLEGYMLDRIKGSRLLSMVAQERHWTDNLKKAFCESDLVYTNGTAVDNAFPAICKAIDVAATLAISLQQTGEAWAPPSTQNRKQKFISFLHAEIPDMDDTVLIRRAEMPMNWQ